MSVRRNRGWWRQAVSDLAESGLHPAEFASRLGVKEATLRWWTSELRLSPAPEPPARGFVEMVATDAGSTVPVDATARPVGVAIRVGGGVTVVLESLPAPEYVARLAAAYDAQRP